MRCNPGLEPAHKLGETLTVYFLGGWLKRPPEGRRIVGRFFAHGKELVTADKLAHQARHALRCDIARIDVS
jgi:hypothetical protein